MTNVTANQIVDNAQATAPVVAKKAPSLLKKLAQFQTPDGLIFGTQKEATEHLRGHLVTAAVSAVAATFDPTAVVQVEGEEDRYTTLAEFLLANKAEILKAYDAAKVERAPVSEATKEKMKAARAKIGVAAEVAPVAEVPAETEVAQ
jgi:hypothetical protein